MRTTNSVAEPQAKNNHQSQLYSISYAIKFCRCSTGMSSLKKMHVQGRYGTGTSCKIMGRRRNRYGLLLKMMVRRRNRYGLLLKMVVRRRNRYGLLLKAVVRRRNSDGLTQN